MKKKKYDPIKIPRKTPSNTPQWFEIVEALNKYSVDVAEQWQDKGLKSVSGYAVMNHKGNLLPSTFSVRRHTAKKRLLEPAMQRFNGCISQLFSEWEKHGYKLVKINWKVE